MYSWQQKQWQHIAQQGAKIPHAMLLRGRVGTGKYDFALNLAKAVLCQQDRDHHQDDFQKDSLHQACGICVSCHWFAEGVHPDFILIGPDDAESADESLIGTAKKKTTKKSQISVTKIRKLIDDLSLSSHQAKSYRVIVISPADMLNGASANALLKMLEEPPARTLFLLVTSQPQRLLATITSRCQAIEMALPTQSEALNWLTSKPINNAENWLHLAGGAPILALQMAEEGAITSELTKHLAMGAKLDPFACAPLFLSVGMERAIDALQKWVFDLQLFNQTQTLHYFLQQANALQALSKGVKLSVLFSFQKQLNEAKKTANHPLSNEAQLENILLQYVQLFTKNI